MRNVFLGFPNENSVPANVSESATHSLAEAAANPFLISVDSVEFGDFSSAWQTRLAFRDAYVSQGCPFKEAEKSGWLGVNSDEHHLLRRLVASVVSGHRDT